VILWKDRDIFVLACLGNVTPGAVALFDSMYLGTAVDKLLHIAAAGSYPYHYNLENFQLESSSGPEDMTL